jgi:hypothetical protein
MWLIPLLQAWNARIRKDNPSGFKGVTRHINGWRYSIGKKWVYGFATAEEAFAERCSRVREEHGEFARFA